jgi:hypothetical protein
LRETVQSTSGPASVGPLTIFRTAEVFSIVNEAILLYSARCLINETFSRGFGPVTPTVPAGQIVTQSNQLAAPFQLLFGQTPAQLTYYGLAPSFVGLYQFNAVVPAVPDNNLIPLTFSLGSTLGTQTIFISVHQ